MANEIARALRKRMTPQEVKLWVHLRSWRTRGFHFRRQAPRDDFIVDFVCLKHRLIVEVDGGQHNLLHIRNATYSVITTLLVTDLPCCASGTTKSIRILKAS